MHLNTSFLPEVSHLPTRRTIHRIRRRYLLHHPRLRWLLAITILILLISLVRLYTRPSPPFTQVANALANCFNNQPTSFQSFDQYMLASKSVGLRENDLENRFQEDVWDTILHTFALFPAWSDMRWNVPQYARELAQDLALVQSLAAWVRGVSDVHGMMSPLSFQNEKSAVRVNYVHHRLDRLRGLQYGINFVLKDADTNDTTYNMLVQRSMDTSKCNVALAESQASQPVYILLPYGKREERLRLFLENYLSLRADFGENLVLIISVLRANVDDLNTVYALKEEIFGKEASTLADSIQVHQNDGDLQGGFSRGVAIREAAKLAPDADSVLFHCDVDMIIKPTFFDRCRHNTVLGSQVYYPVFYSLYPYANSRPQIEQRNGFWRKTSFGMTCMRKGDFEAVGAYDDAETRFQGWGSEDVYQFEKIRNTSNLVAFRAVEPALLHRWHSKTCDTKSAAYIDCMKTNFMTMGHPLRVGPVLLESLHDVDLFFRRLESS